jgi:C-lobe and N-lobe beta barrels of Tf-binding protein B
VTRFALFSSLSCLALLGACQDATTGGGSPVSLGAPSTITNPTDAPKNSTLLSPVVQETYKTFSANQRLKINGTIGADVTVSTVTTTIANVPTINPVTGLQAIDPVTGQPLFTPTVVKTPIAATQLPTAFSNGIPINGNTIKPAASIINTYYEGSQPKGSVSDVTIDFNPRDAVYSIKANTASIVADARLQDPQHRTVYQQGLVPTLANYKYKESPTGKDTPAMNANVTEREVNTIFVRDVGTGAGQTQYVTIAGFVKQTYKEKEVSRPSAPETMTLGVDFDSEISRSVFAYGLNTTYKDIPKSGSATYTGEMFAHVIITRQNNNTGNDLRSIVGTSSTTVDFGSGKLNLTLGGNVTGFLGDTRAFAATGAMDIFKPVKDTENSQFTGAITNWSFGAYNATNGVTVPTAASTVEGGFFGPKGEEIGGAFRIIGNRPDERIDFLGAFTGRKN